MLGEVTLLEDLAQISYSGDGVPQARSHMPSGVSGDLGSTPVKKKDLDWKAKS